MSESLRYTIRAATAADAEPLLGLIQQYYEYDGITFHRAAIERGLLQLLSHPGYGCAGLISTDDEPIGYFVLTYGFDLEFGGRQATLTDLYVVQSCRRSGLGSAALRFVEELLRAQGIGALELQAERDNHEALAFYQRHGFELHDRIPLSKYISAK